MPAAKTQRSHDAQAAAKKAGRPPSHPPRKVTTVRLELAVVAWMDKHLPRTMAVSDFVNLALRDKIAALGPRPRLS